MTLVDTSAWVEHYRANGAPSVRSAVVALAREGAVAVCDIVRAEFVPYVQAAQFEHLRQLFRGYHQLATPPSAVDRAIEVGQALRRQGVTVPATDLLVAATALHHDVELLHCDADFELIGEAEPEFRHRNARPPSA